MKTIANISSAKEAKVSHVDPQSIRLLMDNRAGANSLNGRLNGYCR
jgi:hypothetical protein